MGRAVAVIGGGGGEWRDVPGEARVLTPSPLSQGRWLIGNESFGLCSELIFGGGGATCAVSQAPRSLWFPVDVVQPRFWREHTWPRGSGFTLGLLTGLAGTTA